MITKDLIDRINELSRKQRSMGLTEDEKTEQAKLRGKYLQGIRKQVIDGLEAIKKEPPKNKDSCSCGHCHSKSPEEKH